MTSFSCFRRLPAATVFAAAAVLAAGCAHEASTEEQASSEAHVELAPAVVIASLEATRTAEILPESIRVPLADAAPYAALPPGTVFVGARGDADGKNPDGFLRRIVSVRTEGDTLVITTTPATLTDAIVSGSVHASSSGTSFDSELRAGRDLKLDLDFSNEVLFENVDEVETANGTTRFTETIRFDQAKLFARPSVDVNLRIKGGKASRFLAKVEGQLDASINARAEVQAEGVVSDEALAALRERKHHVEKVLYKSKRIPLPTFAVGRVPVSTAVELSVIMKCDLAFGGPLVARAGVEAKSYVRLTAVQEEGAWAPPTSSDFDIRPSFSIDRGSDVDARCALEASAELSAYGTSGVTMTVAPYVDFDVKSSALDKNVFIAATTATWSVTAGATGAMRGSADVFGVSALDQSLAEWKAEPLRGEVP